jgi:hypothetical protein
MRGIRFTFAGRLREIKKGNECRDEYIQGYYADRRKEGAMVKVIILELQEICGLSISKLRNVIRKSVKK